MLFNSYEFIFIFLPVTFFLYFYLNKIRLIEAAKVLLVISSLFFYSWWDVTYLLLIIISIIFNYTLGTLLNKKEINYSRKSILIFGIIANLSLLAYFKYSDFFIENFNIITNSHINTLHLLLPLAISFFTFQQIAYLVDSYKEETKEYNFLNYTLFVTFFPQLIAGPIVHHKEMMPQFANLKTKFVNYRNIILGFFIFSMGLFKKVAIADTFAVWANNGFDLSENLNLIEAWATSLSYTFQLYFDFSGYTDMAIGLALLFNIKLPINFNSPYKALNIQDFWRRWHMTLSRFLRDYIYFPLGGSKHGNIKTYTNLMITFILGGFWHGAGWTFLFWGFLHGLALSIHRVWTSTGYKMNIFLAWFITFNFVNIAWIFFRAKEWQDAMKVLGSMFGLSNISIPNLNSILNSFDLENIIELGGLLSNIQGGIVTIFCLLIGLLLVTFTKNSIEWSKQFKTNIFYLFFTILLFIISTGVMNEFSEFLYFNF